MTATPEQRAEWRKIADEATEGPWRVEDTPYEGMGLHAGPDESFVHPTDADLKLLGESRTAVPALLDEVDRITRERDEALARIETALRAQIRGIGTPWNSVVKNMAMALKGEKDA